MSTMMKSNHFAVDYAPRIIDDTVKLVALCHGTAVRAGWWHHPTTRAPIERNVGELLMLTVSELAEALDGYYADAMDDHLPAERMFGVELADTLIRAFDYAGRFNMRLDGCLDDLMTVEHDEAWHAYLTVVLRPTSDTTRLVEYAIGRCVSVVAAAMEGHRKGLRHALVPERTAFAVETANLVRHVALLAGAMHVDLRRLIEEKVAYNAQRADHRPENRAKEGGKAY